jgi:hypothetical protein
LDAGVTSVNLEGVTDINTFAFAKNNIEELYIPKSLTGMGAGLFADNELKKLTIKNDDLAIRMYGQDYLNKIPYRVAILGLAYIQIGVELVDQQGSHRVEYRVTSNENIPARSLRELTILAPYDENDTIPERRNINETGVYNYIPSSEIRNVIGANAYEDFAANLDSLTIGEGFDLIDESAFMMPGFGSGYGEIGALRVVEDGYVKTATTKELNLPSDLKAIGRNAFLFFFNVEGNEWEALPDSLVYVGVQAFFDQWMLKIKDIDTKSIKYIGDNAFSGVNIENIIVRDAVEYIGPSSFVGNRNLKTITIDTDLFSKLRQRFSSTFVGNCYSVFSTSYEQKGYERNNSVYEYAFHLDKIVFTDKAVTEWKSDDGLLGMYADEFDVSQTAWKTVPYHAFYRSKIKTIKLPSTIESIENYAFFGAEVEIL